MINRAFGEEFAKEWVAAWNSHDLDRILSHYADDFVMTSPYIAQLAGVASGILTGKAAVRAYWAAALEKLPSLRFEHVQTLIGVDSVTIYYRGVKGMAAEVFFFGLDHLVYRAAAHYE
ncbi:MAG: nuclear transport factor 2 family protein [Nitrospira sp.]|nr:nuclear transport factor 2 family protein [Nitrospira sp.]